MEPPSMAKVILGGAILLLLLSSRAQAQVLERPIAAVPARWRIGAATGNISFADGSQVTPVLVQPGTSLPLLRFACGFFCSGNCTSFLFAVYIDTRSGRPDLDSPRVVWAANRARPVKENATLALTSAGDLVLSDADGAKVWSSGSAGKSVAGMRINSSGNLVLFGGAGNQTVFWESFSSPTDSLVPGQKLLPGQKLTANISSDSSSKGLYFLQTSPTGLTAYVNSTPPQAYASSEQSLDQLLDSTAGSRDQSRQQGRQVEFLRLDSDGSLKTHGWDSNQGWIVVRDIFNPERSSCFSPTACGRYAICTGKEQCVCPQPAPGGNESFQFNEIWNPGAGCREMNPLSCSHKPNHRFLRQDDVSYFGYLQRPPDLNRVDLPSCRDACGRNCSCRAAFFWFVANVSDGACYFTSEVFSLKRINPKEVRYNSTAFIKVQIPLVDGSAGGGENGGGTRTGVIVGAALGGLFGLLVLSGCGVFVAKKRAAAIRRKKDEEEEGGNDLEHVAGMPRRFSLGKLRAATHDFSKKLGQGGFGSVFEGTIDGHPVAVKRLDGVAEGGKQFLAEVQTIGRVHHFHLVKLVGYCAERSAKLLVYEFMSNSSLDHWIFSEERRASLGWEIRRRIILGIAKALAYLHEECSQKIAHLDINPQNILLDQELEPKVADFGLAKLIDRDQTQVETQMRGTLGYLAPEWLSSMITEKADVYSFGVVVLEIVCGRKSIDRFLPEEEALLVDLARRKSRAGELRDLVDKSLDCTKEESEEAARILQLGLWCLLHD